MRCRGKCAEKSPPVASKKKKSKRGTTDSPHNLDGSKESAGIRQKKKKNFCNLLTKKVGRTAKEQGFLEKSKAKRCLKGKKTGGPGRIYDNAIGCRKRSGYQSSRIRVQERGKGK